MTKISNWNFLFFAWFLASVSTLGSLFFSEVMQFPPCVLCWYQRIGMYPLAVILLVGLFPFDPKVIRYSFPFALFGWVVSLYHNLLHYEIVPESASPCLQGVPCSTVFLNWFGFVTIPLLSFISFSLIIIILMLLRKKVAK
jgi:disulfide bond formation protein DsbB